jgi:hypothetical protein
MKVYQNRIPGGETSLSSFQKPNSKTRYTINSLARIAMSASKMTAMPEEKIRLRRRRSIAALAIGILKKNISRAFMLRPS